MDHINHRQTWLPLGPYITAPACARSWARVVLGAWDLYELVETAELIVSELVTNSVQAVMSLDGKVRDASGTDVVHLRLHLVDKRLVIEVWDTISAAPAMKPADLDDESGRGLQLVDMLSDKWGWMTVDNWTGKCVWAELSTLPQSEGV
jgi:anti-sigma regulatory factor (Ser/Thr protein kinase)